jgi:hypothetical protein
MAKRPACLMPYMPLRISRYTQPPTDIARKLYLVMISSGMIDKGRFLMSIIIILASSVDSVLLIRILEVLISAVYIATSLV